MGEETGNDGFGLVVRGVGIWGSRRIATSGVPDGSARSSDARAEAPGTTTGRKAESGIGDGWIGSRPAATLAATVKVPATMSDAAAVSLERDARIREARRAGDRLAPADAGAVRVAEVGLGAVLGYQVPVIRARVRSREL
jgi:hypothetical protein